MNTRCDLAVVVIDNGDSGTQLWALYRHVSHFDD